MNVNIGGFRTLGDPDRNKVANLFIEKIFYLWLCPDSGAYPHKKLFSRILFLNEMGFSSFRYTTVRHKPLHNCCKIFYFYSNSNSNPGRYFLLNRLSTINNEGSRKDGSSNPLFLTFK